MLLNRLRMQLNYDDARLVWYESDGLRHEQYALPVRLLLPWDEYATSNAFQGTPQTVTLLPSHNHDQQQTVYSLSMPVVISQQPIGVLELRSQQHQIDQQAHQNLWGALLPLIAATIHTLGIAPARIRQAANITPHQQQLLDDTRQIMESPLALSDLLARLLRFALDATGAEAGTISMVDHEQRELVVQHYTGYPREPFSRDMFGELRRRWNWEQGLAGQVARTGRPALLRDVGRDVDFLPGVPTIRAKLAIPIIAENKTLAVLTLDSPRSLAFGERELAISQHLCEVAAGPLRRAMWYQHTLETSVQLGQVFASILNGLALLDRQGQVLRYNPAWLNLWGVASMPIDRPFHAPWDLVPLLLPRLVDPLCLNEFCADPQSNPAETQITTVVLRNPHQELSLIATPTRDTIGQLTGRLWIVTDVTKERESERVKSEFISTVSHELRTPLTSILGYTEILLERPFTPAEQREFHKTVFEQADHLKEIVEDLLGMSRLEAGKVALNPWPISLRQTLTEISAQLHPHLNSGRHKILLNIPDRLGPVMADRQKVMQILVNLLTNAVKYSPKGGQITITVSEATNLPADHPTGDFTLISIRDEGLGIAAKDLPRIWERFYRSDNSNTRRIGGTGLGLAITKALVELHGGRIWVESTINVGSTFFFTLPQANEQLSIPAD